MANLKPGRMRQSNEVKGKDCQIPSEPGIYRHIDRENGDIGYVGQSKNLRARQQQHVREGKLNLEKQYVSYSVNSELNKTDLQRIEKEHIARHNPQGNTYRGGNGR
ncbi:MAG: excinuclease ABC subunit C [Pelotomaculum sp. PtaU1.Bin035]|nr:MAG: excinuclease ABC subunit C [Pelotomaculum sp. PtaU1.Bin035]